MRNRIKFLAVATGLVISTGLVATYRPVENIAQSFERQNAESIVPVENHFYLAQLSQKADTILDNAIEELKSESGAWRQTLEDAKQDLRKAGESIIANQVQEVIQRAIMAANIEARCGVDFMRSRLAQDLIRIKDKAAGRKYTPSPNICNIDPKVIDLDDKEGKLIPQRTSLAADGYDFDGSVRVYLIDTQNKSKDITFALAKPSHYLLTLNLGRNGVQFSNTSKLIKFVMPDETFTVNVIQPHRQPLHKQVIEMSGKISMKDAGLRTHSKTITLDRQFVLSPSNRKAEFSDYWCVGKGRKVRGLLDVQFKLDPDTGRVSVEGVTKYFEGGGECSKVNSLRRSKTFQFVIGHNNSERYNQELSDGRDFVNFALTFTNRSKK
jgi:hypothetical protein